MYKIKLLERTDNKWRREMGGAVITICLILFCVNVDAHELYLRALLIKMENLSDFYLHMDDSIFCTLYHVSAGPVSIKTV